MKTEAENETVEKDESIATPEAPETVEPPKKRRGRQPYPRDSDGNIIRPEKPGDAKDVLAPQKRGRPKKSAEIDTAKLARQIQGIHQIGAMVSGIPEFAISGPEAETLAVAVEGVAREYDLSIDGKTGAALQLAFACASVYGPRVFVIAKRRRAEAENGGGDAVENAA